MENVDDLLLSIMAFVWEQLPRGLTAEERQKYGIEEVEDDK